MATAIRGLKLQTEDYFLTDKNAVMVAERHPQPVFPLHHHDFDELVIVWRGNGLHLWNDVPYRITRGDMFYVSANDRHSYESVHELELDNILYIRNRLTLSADWQALLPGGELPQSQRHWCLGSEGMDTLREKVDALRQECMKSDALSLQLSEALLLQIALLAARYRHTPDSPQLADAHQLDMLMNALRASIAAPFRFEAFCEQHHFSARSLRARFKEQTGMSVPHYLRQLRLCKAMELLRYDLQTIGDVAALCGFEDSNYFSVVFHQAFGVSPSAYRQRFLNVE
ncbi:MULTISPECIES: helix-turn-helix domain-containing protein [Pectobacterium]|uniref:helix-turn-helix domain-containing protein n=1 Tax=Pectobacterium TaxID=122277 RepID=UPI00057D119D|nr:helix-turn-helix domain-containing protein [Pectobacterium carotovorum]KHT31928.1 transcriptional regulator [Pectobacterium carotovorum subsp. carotovorum]MCA6968517.1 helix-turn-helix domain-containing protein [Pectobacterium carotovorum]MDY4375222.1 helix-turn-helix domain-containing protein [Pectobacterium carotovorum subsp. carotovorum]WDF99393.1 helix-turn-helix domain-containing protein [Pectobacterium carotovorum subsp. carotovorum]GKV89926.1 HTH-type transcriptional activator RhaR [